MACHKLPVLTKHKADLLIYGRTATTNSSKHGFTQGCPGSKVNLPPNTDNDGLNACLFSCASLTEMTKLALSSNNLPLKTQKSMKQLRTVGSVCCWHATDSNHYKRGRDSYVPTLGGKTQPFNWSHCTGYSEVQNYKHQPPLWAKAFKSAVPNSNHNIHFWKKFQGSWHFDKNN